MATALGVRQKPHMWHTTVTHFTCSEPAWSLLSLGTSVGTLCVANVRVSQEYPTLDSNDPVTAYLDNVDQHLGIAEVHDLVQQLVCNDEVVAQRLLLHFAEIVLEHVQQAVQEEQHRRRVDIGAAHRQKVQVRVLRSGMDDQSLGLHGDAVCRYAKRMLAQYCCGDGLS